MKKQILEQKVHKEIRERGREKSIDLMQMDLMDFLKEKTGAWYGQKKGVIYSNTRKALMILYGGSFYSETIKRRKLKTVSDLISASPRELIGMPYLGPKTYRKIDEILKANGLPGLQYPEEGTLLSSFFRESRKS